MPTENHQNLTLPRERHRQFMELMDAAGARTVSEMMGTLIRSYVEQGGFKHEIPGVRVQRFGPDRINLKIGHNANTSFILGAACELAEAIRDLATGKRKQGVIWISTNDDRPSYSVVRKGNGVQIAVPYEGETKNYTPDLALELADLIEKAVQ